MYGLAVAASGDTVVVGAPNAATAAGKGAAYVFVRNGSGWTLQQKLSSGGPLASQFFASEVAIDGDTIAVGDWTDNGQRGAVFVFQRSSGVWTQQGKLTASDGDGGDALGSTVAISGDTVISGATSEEAGALFSVGAVYVFTRSGGVWSEQQKLSHPAQAQAQSFGIGVGLSGDRAAIGTRDMPDGRGAVFIYERSGGVFAQTAKIAPASLEGGDVFGDALELEGDRLAISARGDDDVAANAGAGYVFEHDGVSWVQRAKLLPSGAVAGDSFGFTLAFEGNLVVLGSVDSDFAGVDAGLASLFLRDEDGAWGELATLIASDAETNWYFSSGLAIADGSVFAGARYIDRPPAQTGCGGRGQPPCPNAPPPKPGSAYEFVVGSIDTQAPEFDIPFDIMEVEATSSAGAEPTFAFTATDDVDGEIDALCVPASGSLFAFGNTVVECTATDQAGNESSDSFTVHVADTTAPDAVCSDVVTECTGPSTSAETSCTATDAVDGDLEITNSAQASYPVSFNTYNCTARDDAGNFGVEQCSVQVIDTVAPTCTAPETGFVECTDEGGVSRGQAFVQQHLNQFEAADLCDFEGTNFEGPLFLPAGCVEGQASTIELIAHDGSGNSASCSTDIVVYDNRAPSLTIPHPVTLECNATGGVAGDDANVASWLAIASVFDRCHDEALTSNAPSFYGVGRTDVRFVGEDTCGNTATQVSSVTVVDTTVPSATCQNSVVECTGAQTPVTTTCGANDICDGSVAVASSAAPSYPRGQHAFTCQAQDDSGNGASASCQISVVDTRAAVIAAIATATAPVAPGTNVAMSASFTAACGPHTGTWTFGDGTTGAATVSEGAGGGTASGSHVYTTAGTYTLTLTLTDASGNVASRQHQSIVVTAPATTRGSVSGAGVIASPRGAYRPSPNSSGLATFTFLASHPLFGGMTPVTGVTDFRMLLPNFSFTSISYQSLTITGAHAKYRGTGRVNGASGYSFLMTVVDGQRSGGGGVDRLHLKVWSTASGTVVYDNEPTVSDTANATASITTGTIAILSF